MKRHSAGWLMLSVLCALADQPPSAPATVSIRPAPPGEALDDGYSLRVNGRPVPVYSCRVSAVPFNKVWPGYQRPLDQTELAGFAHWDMSGPVRVEITVTRPFTNATARPRARDIRPAVHDGVITFDLPEPGPITVELDGSQHALHLFASPPEAGAPRPDAANVRYFGPGVHRPGKLTLQSGETLYLAGGAVVHTAVHARGASGVRILGRGIIDTSEYERDQGGGCIRLTDCSDVKIEGVVLRDPDVWCLSAFGCRDVEIANVKLVGLWRYNADGIDLCNSEDVVVRDSFVRAFDDAIVLKGLNWGRGGFHERPVRNIRVHDNVIWCDWGRALEIGAETSAPEITNVRFQDCDIIRTTHIAMDLQCGDRARVHDITFESIRVEMDDVCPAPRMQTSRDERYVVNPHDDYVPNLLVIVIGQNPYSKDAERGNVRNVTWSNVSVTSQRPPRSFFKGFDAQHTVEDITIENLRLNGKLANSAAEANLAVGPHVSDVRFATSAGDSVAAGTAGEEFAGPFPSWRDARRDYGARGDGQTDDTPALQRALDELTTHTNACVLYLPAGTYRLTGTLKTVRQAHTDGQAENAVLRCQFLRCETGIQTVNWNSMDIWVWSGRFEDCGRGVHNVMGNWHVWESLFLRSRVTDLSSINLMAFSVVNNTSVGSRCFFDFGTGHTWGSPVSLTGNRVLDPTGDWAVLLDNAGPYLVVDNQF